MISVTLGGGGVGVVSRLPEIIQLAKNKAQISIQLYLGVLLYESSSHLLLLSQRATHFYTSLGKVFSLRTSDQRALLHSSLTLPLSPLAADPVTSSSPLWSTLVVASYPPSDSVLHLPNLSSLCS